MKNGFIFSTTRWIMEILQYVNAVEWCKVLAARRSGENTATEKRHQWVSNAVDLYTTVKWLLVMVLWACGAHHRLLLWLTWYLLLTNLHTFVYYFLWKPEPTTDHDRSRKRFIKLLLAILYSHCCFAYLFAVFYADDFTWQFSDRTLPSLWYSISNSLAGNYDAVKPKTELGYSVSTIQYMLTFVFVSVLISKAMPSTPNPSPEPTSAPHETVDGNS